MRLVTLGDLKSQCRARSNMERSGFIKDPELISYINASFTDLYDLLISAYGNEYYMANPYTITTTNGVSSYALPSDFYKLLGVDQDMGANNIVTLKPYMFSERNKYKGPYFSLQSRGPIAQYRIQGNAINFIPSDNLFPTYTLYYIPACPILASDSDEIDGINGWEEYIVLDVAIKMRVKEETDVSDLMVQKNAMYARLKTMAENRDAGASMRVTDVRRGENPYSLDAGWGISDY